MKRYCFDTSGISNPLEVMPADIHESMWRRVMDVLESGCVAVTPEIYDEMLLIPGDVGACIAKSKDLMVLEVSHGSWDWRGYVENSKDLLHRYRDSISEYTGGSPKTVGLNDMSIITLSKTLNVPCVSMEGTAMSSHRKRKIPDICSLEGIEHLTFSEFLRREGVKI